MPIANTAANLIWNSATTSPTLLQDVALPGSGIGQQLLIQAQASIDDNRQAGSLELASGAPIGNNSGGGDVYIKGCDGNGTGNGGSITIRSGNSPNNHGGQIIIQTGSTNQSADSGDIVIRTTMPSVVDGQPGYISLYTENNTNGDGGDILITTGNSNSGHGGNITIHTGIGSTTDGLLTLQSTTINLTTTTDTIVGSAGSASALPANPVGYIVLQVNGISYKMPYFNV